MAAQAFPESKNIKLSRCSFDAMKLQTGERLELEFTGQAGHKPYFSRLIGHLHGQGLIVQTPLLMGCLFRCAMSSRFWCGYFQAPGLRLHQHGSAHLCFAVSLSAPVVSNCSARCRDTQNLARES